MPQNKELLDSVSIDFLKQRVKFLEEQLRAERLNTQYQRYSLMSGDYSDRELLRLLFKLVPHKFRSRRNIYDLAHSKFSWKQLLWRHPFNFKMWLTAKKLQYAVKKF